MIPKIIHYCWFGKGAYTDKVKQCLASWQQVLGDYEIKLWNEENVNLEESPYIRDAYATGNYSFVSDHTRMKVLAEYGGIYLDVDMEVLRPLDSFLHHRLCLGTDDTGTIETVMMAEPHHPILEAAYREYKHRAFILPDGSYNKEVPNVLLNRLLVPYGFRERNERLSLADGIEIYPDDYFQGISLVSGKMHRTENTHIIHWHTLLWVSPRTRILRWLRMKIFVPLLGPTRYLRLKSALCRVLPLLRK